MRVAINLLLYGEKLSSFRVFLDDFAKIFPREKKVLLNLQKFIPREV